MTGGSDGLGREIVLALLIEQPGSTSYELDKQLGELFPGSDWAHGVAMKSLKRLQKDGHAKPIEGSRSRGRLHASGWEPTPDGVQHAKDWGGKRITKLVHREELYALIVLSEAVLTDPAILLRLLDRARTLEQESELEFQRLEKAEKDEHRAPVAPDVRKAWELALVSYYRAARHYLEARLEQPPPSRGTVS